MKRLALAAAALLMSGSIAAYAADLPSPVDNISPGLTEQDIKTGLETLGYTDVFDVRGNGTFYTAQAYYQEMWYPLDVNVDTGGVSSRVNYGYK